MLSVTRNEITCGYCSATSPHAAGEYLIERGIDWYVECSVCKKPHYINMSDGVLDVSLVPHEADSSKGGIIEDSSQATIGNGDRELVIPLADLGHDKLKGAMAKTLKHVDDLQVKLSDIDLKKKLYVEYILNRSIAVADGGSIDADLVISDAKNAVKGFNELFNREVK